MFYVSCYWSQQSYTWVIPQSRTQSIILIISDLFSPQAPSRILKSTRSPLRLLSWCRNILSISEMEASVISVSSICSSNPHCKFSFWDYIVAYVIHKAGALSFWAVCLCELLVPSVILAHFIGHALYGEGAGRSPLSMETEAEQSYQAILAVYQCNGNCWL